MPADAKRIQELEKTIEKLKVGIVPILHVHTSFSDVRLLYARTSNNKAKPTSDSTSNASLRSSRGRIWESERLDRQEIGRYSVLYPAYLTP